MKPSILLIGYYGKGNAGDEWLKEKTIEILNKAYPNAIITEKKSSFFKNSIIVYGGGGLLQNTTSNQSLLYYSFWIILASIFNKKIYLLGQGIGPIKGSFWNKLTTFCLRKTTALSVRDKQSFHFAKNAGASQCVLAPDLAFYNSIFIQTHTTNTRIALNLRPWKHAPKKWQTISKWLHSQSNEFIACSPEDSTLKRHLPSTDLLTRIHSPNMDKPLILIAMRFHACVWAALNGIPFIAIVYDPKVKHLAETLQQPYIDLASPTLNETQIQNQIENLIQNHSIYQSHLRKTLPKILEEAMIHDTLFKK